MTRRCRNGLQTDWCWGNKDRHGEAKGRGTNETPDTLPPSHGRRCPEGAEVGSRSGVKRNGKQSFHVSASHVAEGGASRDPSPHSAYLTANEKDFSLSLEMTMRGKAAFRLRHREGEWLTSFLPVKEVLSSKGREVGSKRFFTRGDANPASLRSSAPSRGRGENDS